MKVETVCVVQCRMSSSRLPRKAMLDLCGQPLLIRVLERCRMAAGIDKVVVATSTDSEDDLIEYVCRKNGVECFRGSLLNVRSRFLSIIKDCQAKYVVRVTADNPLTEPLFIETLLKKIKSDSSVQYAIMDKNLIPKGTGSEVFTAKILEESASQNSSEDIEHVTVAVRNLVPSFEIAPPPEFLLENENLSVDSFKDYLKMYDIFSKYKADRFILKNYIAALKNS